MTDNQDPRSRALAEAAARLVREGVAPDAQSALDHVMSEEAGRRAAQRFNADRFQTPKTTEEQK